MCFYLEIEKNTLPLQYPIKGKALLKILQGEKNTAPPNGAVGGKFHNLKFFFMIDFIFMKLVQVSQCITVAKLVFTLVSFAKRYFK